MKPLFSLLLRNIFITFCLIFVSFQDPYSIKRISDKNFRYEFFTITKKINPKRNKTYFWFKGGLIHQAEFGIAGEVLNGSFKKYFHSNQLAEQGEFNKGLKIGLWKSWHENGKIETTQTWRSGQKNGDFFKYNNSGEIIEKGKFSKNLKHGLWIDLVKKDTVIYKNGNIFIKKKKLTKEEKEKIKLEKKLTKEKKEKRKSERKSKTQKTNSEKNKTTKKPSWFSKLFKKNKANGKST